MINKPLNSVQNVAPGSVATIRITPENLTLIGAKLMLTGTTFTTAHIDSVVVKVGPKKIWELTGAQLLAINAYKNGSANTKFLYLDFTERDQEGFPIKEAGALDLMALLAVGEVYIEIKINAGAVAPKIDAVGYYTRTQGNPWVLKMLPYTWSTNAAGRFILPLNFRGAMIKRVHLQYTGTDWAAAADGNVNRLEVKKNSLTVFDETCQSVRFMQNQFKKVPQSRFFVADFILDNNPEAHLQTVSRVKAANGQVTSVYDAFEFSSYITDAGGATVNVIVEALDAVGNL